MITRLDEITERARKFHAEHPEVWDLFCMFAFGLIDKGFKRYSADAVMHRVRWETSAGRPNANGEAPFKINNNFIAIYARAFMRSRFWPT
jgi:hypothetical protein